jgi:uncharacterized protein YbdZ (MbtH family)
MYVRIVDTCLQLEQADSTYYKYKMIVHAYEKSYKGDSKLEDYFRFKMASSANLRRKKDGINNLTFKSNISSISPQRTFVQMNIGSPKPNIKQAFLDNFLLKPENNYKSCLALTPILFLTTFLFITYIIISILYRYFLKEWQSSSNSSKEGRSYELLKNEEDSQSLKSDSVSITSFEGWNKTHKRQPSNNCLDTISVQTI